MVKPSLTMGGEVGKQRKGGLPEPTILCSFIYPSSSLCLATAKHPSVAKADTGPKSPPPEAHLHDNTTLVVKEEQPGKWEMPCLQPLCCVSTVLRASFILNTFEGGWKQVMSESEY